MEYKKQDWRSDNRPQTTGKQITATNHILEPEQMEKIDDAIYALTRVS